MSTQLFARPAAKRQWHAEAMRQDAINSEAKEAARHIKSTLSLNARNLSAVSEAMQDQIGQEEMQMILECLERGNDGLLGLVVILSAVKEAAIYEVAEYHAIKVVEELGTAVLNY